MSPDTHVFISTIISKYLLLIFDDKYSRTMVFRHSSHFAPFLHCALFTILSFLCHRAQTSLRADASYLCVCVCVLAAAAAGKTSAHALSLDKVLSSGSASLQCPTLNTVYIYSTYRSSTTQSAGFKLEMYYYFIL